MAYPPEVPPANRTNDTQQLDAHASDHNLLAAGLTDVIAELGPDPSAGYPTLTQRLEQLALDAAGAGGVVATMSTVLGSTTGLAAGVTIPVTDARLTYRGATDFGYGAAFPDTTLYQPTSKYPHTWTGAQPVWSVEFMTDAPVFEFLYKHLNVLSAVRLVVDGVRVTPTPVGTGASTLGSRHVTTFTLGAVKLRRIRLEFNRVPFGGLFLPPTASLFKVRPYPRRLIILGDSITGGSAQNTGEGAGTWMHRTADLLDFRDAWNQAIGGTGYVAAGSSVKFGDRVAADVTAYAPTDVWLWGGFNDQGTADATVRAAVDACIAAIKAGTPTARLKVIGCYTTTSTVLTSRTAIDNVLKAAALAAAIPFISPITGEVRKGDGTLLTTLGPIMTGTGRLGATAGNGNADVMVGTDNTHPTDAGHEHIGRWMAEALRALADAGIP